MNGLTCDNNKSVTVSSVSSTEMQGPCFERCDGEPENGMVIWISSEVNNYYTSLPLPNLRNNICFITEQNPVKALLSFAIIYYFLKLEGFSFFFFPLILGKKKKNYGVLCGIQESTRHSHPALRQISEQTPNTRLSKANS